METTFNVRIGKLSEVPAEIIQAAEEDKDIKSFIISSNGKVILDDESYAVPEDAMTYNIGDNYELYTLGEKGMPLNEHAKYLTGADISGAVIITGKNKALLTPDEIDDILDNYMTDMKPADTETVYIKDNS